MRAKIIKFVEIHAYMKVLGISVFSMTVLSLVLSSCSRTTGYDLPQVTAHRGFYVTGESFENTINSLSNAQEAGFSSVEFDVNLTLDDSLMILHGPCISGTDVNIQKSTYEEVCAQVLPGGHKVPTLDQWLAQGRLHPECLLIMELKKHATPQRETQLVEAVYKKVKEYGMLDQVQFMSFSLHLCQEALRLDPDLFVVYVSSNQRTLVPAELHEMGIRGVSYELNVLMNFPELADEARALGMKTTLWMVEDPEVVDWAWKHGIDYVSTDFPDLCQDYINALGCGRRSQVDAAADAFRAKDKDTFKIR